MSSILAALHLLALGIGLGGVYVRGRQLRYPLDDARLRNLFAADNAWGVAAVLWLVTGLWRFLGGVEKPTGWYLHNPLFHAKLTLFILILAFEAYPMTMLIKWRIRVKKNMSIDPSPLSRMRLFNRLEIASVVIIVFIATFMARGHGI
ncbi:DUF2214 family protein [Pendulispora brunnea]|uniref:DUF2214 family protein n=1 Tax=Pendulispora brunnea TaxID=2905690 RepID=A0ABZ2KFK8_9BACT